MTKFPSHSLTVTCLSPQDRKNMATALRYIAGLIEDGHSSEGGIVVNMPTDTSAHLSADFTISLVKPEQLQ